MKKALFSLTTFLSLLLLFHPFALAIPKLISYQGTLNDANGLPVSSTVSITFKIFDIETGGVALWSETQNVPVSNGLFNVKLGSEQEMPSSVFLSDELYLGIQVGADPEMVPRQRITAGAYVQSAIPIGVIMAWAKSIAGVPSLPEGWVECNGQVISDPKSPLNGQTIPNLNGNNHILMGNSNSGGVSDLSHNHTITGRFVSDGGGNGWQAGADSWTDLWSNPGAGSDSKKIGFLINPANQPIAYNVVWIIRIK